MCIVELNSDLFFGGKLSVGIFAEGKETRCDVNELLRILISKKDSF